MEDDLIASLTRQVKEEVVENYLTERRLLELQVEDLLEQANQTRLQAARTGRRLTRLAYLVIKSDMQAELLHLMKIPENSFWSSCITQQFTRGVRFIRVRGFTDKAKFRKLFVESYVRFYQRMVEYQKAYNNLKAECQAVNSNIKRFRNNFDLLTIINFLKSLDTVTLERKIFLGENFTAAELASIDQKLQINLISFELFDVPPPLTLPKPERMEEPLSDLAVRVYRKFQTDIKRIMC
ncbi:hypothetical protein [Desulfoferrobacter suflitae]|uniref:hypothetical protein n=1 Tax=Desulfoferrobacter suflitae TaxID=2865782 RepID=UPI0021645B59|nr:hypothetical protein [Desulfoferrobacter suflitae]MCK8600290.1 hypothetical protein [Desulfoferrobacter suflitae]